MAPTILGSDLQGVLVVMLIFSVLELLLAAYASVFWWKEIYSSNPGVSTLTCHMIPAGSQDLSYDDQVTGYMWKVTSIVRKEFN